MLSFLLLSETSNGVGPPAMQNSIGSLLLLGHSISGQVAGSADPWPQEIRAFLFVFERELLFVFLPFDNFPSPRSLE